MGLQKPSNRTKTATNIERGFPGGSVVQNPPASEETQETLKGKGAAEDEMVR